MDELIFRDPPVQPFPTGKRSRSDRRRGKGRTGVWLARLKQHPGVWAQFPEPMKAASSRACYIRYGTHYGIVEGEYEAAIQSYDDNGNLLPDGKSYLFARYLGPKEKRPGAISAGEREELREAFEAATDPGGDIDDLFANITKLLHTVQEIVSDG